MCPLCLGGTGVAVTARATMPKCSRRSTPCPVEQPSICPGPRCQPNIEPSVWSGLAGSNGSKGSKAKGVCKPAWSNMPSGQTGGHLDSGADYGVPCGPILRHGWYQVSNTPYKYSKAYIIDISVSIFQLPGFYFPVPSKRQRPSATQDGAARSTVAVQRNWPTSHATNEHQTKQHIGGGVTIYPNLSCAGWQTTLRREVATKPPVCWLLTIS